MKTERIMIDVDDGMVKVRVQDEEVSFNVFEAMLNPREKGVSFNLDAVDEMIMDVKEHLSKQAEETTRVEECLNEKSAST